MTNGFFHYICPGLKTFNDILISVLLVLTVSLYLGHDIVDYYSCDKGKIENTANSEDSQSLISTESSSEEEVPFVFPKNSIQISNSGCASFAPLICFFPHKLYYSIWLPPDIS
jgi:hypothetical protein